MRSVHVALGTASILTFASYSSFALAESGQHIGYTWAQCTAGLTVDADHDSLDDECELALASEFQPRLRFASGESAKDRHPYWAVKPTGTRTARIYYAMSYFKEMPLPFMGSHVGDTEFVVLQVEWQASDRWKSTALFTSAHYLATDDSAWATLSNVHWYGNTYGRPWIFVAYGKHGNYVNLDDCPAYDTCNDGGPEEDVQVLSNRNLGNYFYPLNDSVASSYGDYTEHYWGPNWGAAALEAYLEADPANIWEHDNEEFCGWRSPDPSLPRCVEAKNSNLRQLCDFDFCDGNSRETALCGSCTNDSDCKGGGTCSSIGGASKCTQACDESVSCPAGYACSSNECVPKSGSCAKQVASIGLSR